LTLATAPRTDQADAVTTLVRLAGDRFTCRAYRADPVNRATIDAIARLAQRTASWCNVQPWQLVITSGNGTERFREALSAHAAAHDETDSDFAFPEEYRGTYLARRREAGFQLYNALGIGRGDKAAYARQSFENFRLFGAPHVAIITTPAELGPYGAVDCGAYVGLFLLAAQAHGVATTPQAALARHAGFIRRHFGIGEERKVVCGIAFGYADHDHAANSYRTTRARTEDAVSWVDD
jgi:nitroreductase